MKRRVQRITVRDKRIYSSLEDASSSQNRYSSLESTLAHVLLSTEWRLPSVYKNRRLLQRAACFGTFNED